MRIIQFSHIEKAGIFLLIAIVAGSIITIEMTEINKQHPVLYEEELPFDSSDDITERKELPKTQKNNNIYLKNKPDNFEKVSFDPNQISADSLLSFGLPQKIVTNWAKYVAKGGKFRQIEDVTKIYGMSEHWFNELKPYMHIRNKQEYKKTELTNIQSAGTESTANKYGKKDVLPVDFLIDINKASADDFIKLKGIGHTLSQRIIKYREALGGFYQAEQISEVYGISDSLFSIIKSHLSLNEAALEKLPINNITLNQLARHPYIGYDTAKRILNYRDQRKGISSRDELYKIYLLDKKKLDKVMPYLEFSDLK